MTASEQTSVKPAAVQGPVGLGGWLILPAIGLMLTPFRVLGSLATDFLPLFDEGVWEALTTPDSPAYHPLWAPLIGLEILVNIVFLALSVVLIYMFFTKNWRFPRLMIAFLGLNAAFVVGDWLLSNLIPAVAAMDPDPEVYREMMRAVGGAMIWIPYFMVSRRVENTFVKPGLDRAALEAFD